MNIEFVLNGTPRTVDTTEIPPMTRLLDVIRSHFDLTGTKEGCGEGECGACSVFVDRTLVNSCIVPLGQVDGCEVQTIEYVRETESGRLLVDAFAEAHSVQCGFCTPGMILASVDLLRRDPDPDEQTIRRGISGNICRCTGYDMIVEGVLLAAERAGGAGRAGGPGGSGGGGGGAGGAGGSGVPGSGKKGPAESGAS
jgi:carbon-monoxide dehydrogenase small subunit